MIIIYCYCLRYGREELPALSTLLETVAMVEMPPLGLSTNARAHADRLRLQSGGRRRCVWTARRGDDRRGDLGDRIFRKSWAPSPLTLFSRPTMPESAGRWSLPPCDPTRFGDNVVERRAFRKSRAQTLLARPSQDRPSKNSARPHP